MALVLRGEPEPDLYEPAKNPGFEKNGALIRE
jgi:hypothetical protein